MDGTCFVVSCGASAPFRNFRNFCLKLQIQENEVNAYLIGEFTIPVVNYEV
jgi:hypothetical protein